MDPGVVVGMMGPRSKGFHGWPWLAGLGSAALAGLLVVGAVWHFGVLPGVVVAALLVLAKRQAPTAREAALLLVGYVGNWLVLAPAFLYPADIVGGNQVPRPFADAAAGFSLFAALPLAGWVLACPFLVPRFWPAAVVSGAAQVWIAFTSVFVVAGAVTGAWL